MQWEYFTYISPFESAIQSIIYLVLFTILTISMYTDWKSGKLYNKITYTGIILGFLLNSIAYGSDGFISCMINLAISLIFFGIFYLLHGLAAGDVKLIVACSVLTNVFYTSAALIVGTTLSAFYGIYKLLQTRNRRVRIPYGTFIGLGFYLYQIAIFLWG